MKVYGSIAAIVISLSFLWVGADARVGGAVKVLDVSLLKDSLKNTRSGLSHGIDEISDICLFFAAVG